MSAIGKSFGDVTRTQGRLLAVHVEKEPQVTAELVGIPKRPGSC
jgi:hypothetical protein